MQTNKVLNSWLKAALDEEKRKLNAAEKEYSHLINKETEYAKAMFGIIEARKMVVDLWEVIIDTGMEPTP